MTPVCLELGKQRVFASALDWPGWCRAGRDEASAASALASAAPRYAVVAGEAHVRFAARLAQELDVIERLAGSASTDFGVPGAVAAFEAGPITRTQAERLVRLVAACWTVFDRVVAHAPAELRKGPRGGGRDRDKIVDHVLGAEGGYARQLGLRLGVPAYSDSAALADFRAAQLGALRGLRTSPTRAASPPEERGETSPREEQVARARWPARYAARRIAWHVLDHAWEMEDRSDS